MWFYNENFIYETIASFVGCYSNNANIDLFSHLSPTGYMEFLLHLALSWFLWGQRYFHSHNALVRSLLQHNSWLYQLRFCCTVLQLSPFISGCQQQNILVGLLLLTCEFIQTNCFCSVSFLSLFYLYCIGKIS